jgi:hypothetical protein
MRGPAEVGIVWLGGRLERGLTHQVELRSAGMGGCPPQLSEWRAGTRQQKPPGWERVKSHAAGGMPARFILLPRAVVATPREWSDDRGGVAGELRGLPAVGWGVGGVQPGTQPKRALLAKEGRRR